SRGVQPQPGNFYLYPSGGFLLSGGLRPIFSHPVVPPAQAVLAGGLPGTSWPSPNRAGDIDLSLHLSRTGEGETMLLGIITSTNAGETVDAFEGVAVDLYYAPKQLLSKSDGEQRGIEDATPLLSTQVDDVGNIFLEPVPPG